MGKWNRHFVFWLCYYLFEAYLEFQWLNEVFRDFALINLIAKSLSCEGLLLLIKIPLVYLSFKIVDNFSFSLKSQMSGSVLFFLLIFIATIIHRYISFDIVLMRIYELPQRDEMFSFGRIISSFLDLIFIVGVANAIKQYRAQQRLRSKEKELIKEKLESELNFLKSQINPHFLFNTLNNLYALALKNSKHTPEIILKLSKLLRFMLYEVDRKTISISEELRVIDDYLEIERIRYNERLEIHFERVLENDNHQITPLILLPLVENAFKHGAGESFDRSFIHINLYIRNALLTFNIENSKELKSISSNVDSIGLKNLKRQLELSYNSYTLDIDEGESTFSVQLMIDLNSYANV